MNIFSVIKKDHDEAREVMDKILKTKAIDPRLELYEKLKIAIIAHAKSEEKTFYEALKDTSDARDEPYLEKDHEDVVKLFKEIDKLDADSSEWWEKFGECRMGLLHHMEEEEKKIFKDVKKEISAGEAEALGEKMQELEAKKKAELEKKAA